MPFLLDYTYTYLFLEKLLETGSVITCPRVRAEEVILECLQHYYSFFFLSLDPGQSECEGQTESEPQGQEAL